MSEPAPQHFRARIHRQGVLRCVDVPAGVVGSLPPAKRIPVVVKVGGVEKRTSLAPRAEGGFRLFLDSRMRKAAGVDTGEVVAVELWADPQGWREAVPTSILAALKKRPGGRKMFDDLTPALRREFIRFIETAKTATTREKRLDDAIERLMVRAVERRSKTRAKARGQPTTNPGREKGPSPRS